MKKILKRLTKKSFALFMTVVMLLSCWVWFAPVPEAQAANGSNLTNEELEKIALFFGVEASDAIVQETYGKYFANDGNSYTSDANLNSIYNNVLYSGNAAEAVNIGKQNIRSSRGELTSTYFYYPATVLFYDGVTTPQFGVSMALDGGTDAYIQHYGTSISGTGLGLGKWRGYEDDTSGRWNNPVIFLDIYSGSTGSTITGDNSSTTNTMYHQGTSGSWTTYANVIQVTSAPSDYYTSVSPKFTVHVGVPAHDDDCDDNDLAAATATYTTGNATTIYIINTVTWGQALYDACKYYIDNETDIENKDYTNLEDYKKIVRDLFAANPNKITTWGSDPATACGTYKTNASKAVTAWNEFKGLQEKKYTVTWQNENGTPLGSYEVTKGTIPAYTGATPTKEPGNEWTYTFNGWINVDTGETYELGTALPAVKGDVKYKANFKNNTRYYTVKFYAYKGATEPFAQKDDYVYNQTIQSAPTPEARTGYTFKGWAASGLILGETVVKGDISYTAQWDENYTVNFYQYDETGSAVLLKSHSVTPGEKITDIGFTIPGKPYDENEHFKFNGWLDKKGNKWTTNDPITASIDLYADYSAEAHIIEYEEKTERTCTKNAIVVKKCSCGYRSPEMEYVKTNNETLNDMYLATGEHDMDYNTYVYESTDVHKFECRKCDYEEFERHFYLNEDGSLDDEYSVKLGDATCVKEGTISYLCPCTANVKGVYTDKNAHLYDYTVGTPIGGNKHTVACTYERSHTKEVECTDVDGNCRCDICDQELTTHTYDQKKAAPEYLKEDAKCEVNAIYYYSCQCGKAGTDTWELEDTALTHEWIETEKYPATKAECGVNATYYYECSLCGISSAAKTGATWEKADSALEHVFDGEVVNNGDGTHSYRCSLCENDVKGATTECTYGEWDKTGDTDHVKTCTECKYELVEEHDWSAWTSTNANLQADGEHTKTCSVCDKVVTENCTYDLVETAVSCLKAGYTTHTCKFCGHEYVTEGTEEAKGHDYTGEIIDNKDGTHSYLCKNGCGTYGYNDVEGDSAPCEYKYENTASGKHEAICKECGYTKTENCSGGQATCSAPATCDKCNKAYGDATDHSFKGDVVELDGGKHAYLCVYCKDTSIYGVGSKENATEDCKFNGEVVALGGGKHAYKCSICKDDDYGNEEACSGGTATCIDLAVCAICQETYGELNSEAHVWGDWTSDGNGNHTRTCTLGCTLGNRTETVACTTENAAAVKTPATCNKNSYTTYTVNDCGYEWEVEDENTALGHEWSAWTKNGDGTHTRTCLRECGEADATQTLNCADNAEAKVTAPTCLEGGYTNYTCKDCGHTWEDESASNPAKGHTFETKRVADELIKTRKDCTTPLTYWYICNDCELSAKEVENDTAYAGKTLFWQSEAAAGHNFTAEIADEKYLVAGSSATCTTKVQYYKSCKACGLSSEGTTDEATFESGKILGHNWVKPADDKLATYLATPADCITDATYYYVCSRCDISSKGVISATWAKAGTKTGHDFDHNNNGQIKDEGDTGYTAYAAPTCDKKGIKEHYTCEVCKKNFADTEGKTVITETSIKASGHAWVSVAYKAATCEEDGYARHQKCTVCGAESDHDKYPMLGHTYDAKYGYYCDEDNDYHAYGCKNGCGTYGVGTEKYTVILDDAGKVAEIKGGVACDFSGEYVKVENEGAHSHKKVCECGNEKSEACSDAKPETIAPSCAAEGYDLYVCDTCSQEWKTNYTNKTEHDYSKATWEAAAGDVHIKKCSNYDKCKSYIEEACYSDDTSTGTGCGNQKTCKVCNDTFGASVQHDWVEKVDAKYLKSAANCDSPAVYYVSCSQCGKAHETVTFTHGEKRAHEMSDYVFTIEGWAFAPADFDVSQLKKPNCGSEGKSISYCANCDYYKFKIEISSSTSHTWKYDIDNVDKWEVVGGNCGTGVTKKNYCTVCGETTTKTVADPHAWSAVVIENATCTDNGFIELTCTTCFADKLLSGAKKADFVFDGVDYAAKYPAVIAKGHHEWVDTAAEGEATMEVDGKLVFVEKYPAYNADGRGYSKCKVCAVKEPVKIPAYGNDPANHKHPELGEAGKNTLKTVAKVEPTCIVGGHLEYKECTRCSYSQYMIDHDAFYLAPLGHSDSDNNGECDVCEKNLNGDKTDNCSCMCHKDSGFMKFIYKILRFFWKLFGSNKTCDCGKVHY